LVGDQLDAESDFAWVSDIIARPQFEAYPNIDRWLIDSVRKPRQVEILKRNFGGAVFHLHLDAAEDVLRRRYDDRAAKSISGTETAFDDVIAHENERIARSLTSISDIEFRADRSDIEDVLELIANVCASREEICIR
jgi:adenylosuccinate synthase